MTLKTIFLAGSAALALTFAAAAQMQFSHTVEGTPLDLSFAPEDGRDTEAVKAFLETGVNQYNEEPAALKDGEELYLTACSGCHGHTAEGKLGPGLNDSYWTYPKNETDKGLFETIYGGAQGMMGPQYGHLNLDEMLKVMAWTRHLFTGDPSEAVWLTREQRQSFKPYGSEGG